MLHLDRPVFKRRVLGKADDRKVDFLAFAEHYVNQLDPLHPEPRDPDLQHERSFHVGTEETYRDNERQRLSGHTWERASKLIADTDGR